MKRAVCALGVTQITVWGTSYYCLGVLAQPISDDTGWSRGLVFLGFSIALVVMGIVSTSVGRAIDRHGARIVMTLGTAIICLGLVALAHAHSEARAELGVLGLGCGLRLYDPRCARSEVAPSPGEAISYLTMFGASTIGVLGGRHSEEAVGWRRRSCCSRDQPGGALPLTVRTGPARDPRRRRPGRVGEAGRVARCPSFTGRARHSAIALHRDQATSTDSCSECSTSARAVLEAAGSATRRRCGARRSRVLEQFIGSVVEMPSRAPPRDHGGPQARSEWLPRAGPLVIGCGTCR